MRKEDYSRVLAHVFYYNPIAIFRSMSFVYRYVWPWTKSRHPGKSRFLEWIWCCPEYSKNILLPSLLRKTLLGEQHLDYSNTFYIFIFFFPSRKYFQIHIIIWKLMLLSLKALQTVALLRMGPSSKTRRISPNGDTITKNLYSKKGKCAANVWRIGNWVDKIIRTRKFRAVSHKAN